MILTAARCEMVEQDKRPHPLATRWLIRRNEARASQRYCLIVAAVSERPYVKVWVSIGDGLTLRVRSDLE